MDARDLLGPVALEARKPGIIELPDDLRASDPPMLFFDGLTVEWTSSPHIAAGSRLRPNGSRGAAIFRAIAQGLQRVLAQSGRAWALAAGVPPDLFT